MSFKKYRNCVYYNADDIHVIWHYSGKFYIGGWRKDLSDGEKEGFGI
jgi:hypothetical protein